MINQTNLMRELLNIKKVKMEETKQFRVGFGAMVPPIAKQLEEQGFRFDVEVVKHFEKLRESITYLQFSDLINDKAIEKATQKLFTKIRQHVMKKNNLKIVQKKSHG